ncbi:MAG: UDP-3-O-acyl-N-acetylglucosamine deacetylase [Gammaproteobacteria bacterium]|nr:UDP-3-O-acyl-N-acetylglucosamine deacetylase [Gammaproteobacteria bacterium]
MLYQRTIDRPAHAIGIGVHTGRPVRMTLRPAEPDTGIEFHRVDLPGRSVKALAQNVSDTTLATSIGASGVQVATVEHLMSALWGMAIDNVRVELSDEEVPIMDGSARPFVELIQGAGILTQSAPRKFIRITRRLSVSQGAAQATLAPYDGFRASYTFVADHPVFNRYPKHIQVDFSDTSYLEDVCGARSFGLMDELGQARAIRKCLGSSLDNAVGIDDSDIVNSEGLRYEDEFVKHKLLDAIGDLYLLGLPVVGAFEGYMSGHALNNKLARALLRCTDAWTLEEASADAGRQRATSV